MEITASSFKLRANAPKGRKLFPISRALNQEKHSFPDPHFLKFALEEYW
jgi:hypothetical protein